MEKDKKKIWFPAKKYGNGWGFPVTWQGWIVLLSYILLILKQRSLNMPDPPKGVGQEAIGADARLTAAHRRSAGGSNEIQYKKDR